MNLEDVERGFCAICLKNMAKYTCPRCNTKYCGVECYKSQKHGNCSESFYKDCFMSGLQAYNVSSEEKQKMLEMLERVENEAPDDNEDDEDNDLEERLSGLDLDRDTNLIWKRLTEQEKEDFRKMAEDGRLGNLIEIWTPWWNVKKEKIKELDCPANDPLPRIVKNIPDVSKLLTKSKPSADIKNNMVNILYAYAYVCRLYNGSHWDCPEESSLRLLKCCDVLNLNTVCGSPSEAVQLCMMNPDYDKNREIQINLIKDVIQLIQGPEQGEQLLYVTAALSDILQLLKKGCKLYKKDIVLKKSYVGTDDKHKLFYAVKKVEFLIGWTQRFGMAMLAVLPELHLEHGSLHGDLSETSKIQKSVEDNMTMLRPKTDQKTVIEEVAIK